MKKQLTLSGQYLVKGIIQGCARESFAHEGQRISVQKRPVDLEPVFHPYTGSVLTGDLPRIELEQRWDIKRPVPCFIRLWFSEKSKASWQDFDLVRGLTIVKNPIHYIVIGNKEAITHVLVVDVEDIDLVKNALKAKFPDMECELTLNPFVKFKTALKHICSHDFDLRDYYTPPAYWRRLTVNENLKSSPLLPIYSTLNSLNEDEVGFYLVTFKPVVFPWSKNMLALIDTETEISKYGNINISNSYYPGFGDSNNRSKVSSPIFAVSVRICTFCKKDRLEGAMNSLSLAFTNFQSSGESLKFLSKSDYEDILDTPIKLLKIIPDGYVYHSGNLLNSEETSYFFHFSKEIVENKNYRIDRIEGFSVPDRLKQNDGVIIGYNDYAGRRTIITQPENVRRNHTLIIGRIDKGKSVEMENMILDDLLKGKGVGVIDRHGFLIEHVLRQIPEKYIEKTVYFTMSGEKTVPCYNICAGKDIDKVVDDNVNRFKSLFPSTAWGYGIEDTLRHCFYAVTAAGLPLVSIRVLLSRNSEGERIRKYILPYLKNKEEELFWTEEFRRIPTDRVASKMTLFLQPKRTRRIFSQIENKIDFRDVIDNGKIFLGDLRSGVIGNHVANIMGSSLFSSFCDAGMSRMDMIDGQALNSDSEVGRPFALYIDEFYRYPTKSLEHSLRELRKFGIRVNLALQQKQHMNDDIKSAMDNIGTQIVLSVGWDDAQGAHKEFFGEIEASKFMRRGRGDGFVIIGEDMVNLKTFAPKKIKDDGSRDKIIQHSFKHYYTKIDEDKLDFVIPLKSAESQKKTKILYDKI